MSDSRAVLRAASELLEGEGIAVVGVAVTGAEAGRVIAELDPGVILVDSDLGAESGLNLTLRLGDEAGSRRRSAGSWPELTAREGTEPEGTR
jgi:chemotaxis response regulator CheB